MSKNVYQAPEMTITSFPKIDVMLASGNKGFQSDFFEKNPFLEGGN